MEGHREAPSLQQAFLQWRRSAKPKAKGKQHAGADVDRGPGPPLLGYAALAAGPCKPLLPGATSRKQVLRAMFLQLVQGYIGVPYAKRFHEPTGPCTCEGCSLSGRQLAREPLFLDCCGLVRRAVRRMQQILGFRLGPGNQSYQYDTLPLRVSSISELEPGDLVFYSGTSHNPEAKRHRFDLTHVEVFVGGSTGEATIGSRERYKWVMQYDSYRFVSQRWSLISHHFCKIDTWLEGMCKPQHPEFWPVPWGTNPEGAAKPQVKGALRWDSTKRSIFSGADVEEEQDGQQASDDDAG